MLSLHLLNASVAILFKLHCCQALLLVHDLILHAIFLLDFKALELLLLLVLLLDNLGLFGFFASRLENRLLNLSLFICTLLLNREIALCDHALILILHLIVINFLLDSVFVSLLQSEDLICTLLSIVNFLPCLILLLLKQGDTIGQELGITLNATVHESVG